MTNNPGNELGGTNTNNQSENIPERVAPSYNAGKKRLKEYLLEGLLIFVAVSMGFIAENVREEVKEHSDIKESMISLLDDLKSDIEKNGTGLIRNEYSIQQSDSLIYTLNHRIQNTKDIYFFSRAVTVNIDYLYPNMRTFEQMKSSGLLRAIKNKQLANLIGIYYSGFQAVDYQTALINQKIIDVHAANAEVLNAFVLHEQASVKISDSSIIQKVARPTTNPPLLTSDKIKINKVAIQYLYLRGVIILYNEPLKKLNEKAKDLIEEIKKEYNLEVE
jgi:hypothetical protein